jgi:uncharacterized protein (TIGR02996 family)
MSIDHPLLHAIVAAPNDTALRLSYADWLEEHGQAECSQLIKTSEAMRRVANFSDEYWMLKARRNAMLPRCSSEWLAATGYDGARYDPLYRDGLPPNWKGWWRLIREFTERWYGIPMSDVGGHHEEVEGEERRLGRQLPPSVREYIAYAHDVAPDRGFGIVHRDCYTMQTMVEHSALSVMVIAEGNVQWGIHYDDLVHDDPPVYAYLWPVGEYTRYIPSEGGMPESSSLSEFALGFVTAYKPDGGMFSSEVDDERELLERLDACLTIRLDGRDGATYGFVADGQSVTYEGDGILVSLCPSRNEPGFRLNVSVHRSTTWERVPRFLWRYAQHAHSREGMFLSEEDRRSSRLHWGDQPLPGWLGPAPPPLQDSLIED